MHLTLSIFAQLALVSTAIPPDMAPASNYYCTTPFFPYVRAYLNDTLNGYWLKAPTPLADSTYAVLEKNLSSTSFTKTACWNGTDEDIQAGRGSLRFKGEDSPHGLLRWDYSYELVIEEFNQTYRPMRIEKGTRSGTYGYGMGSTSKISPGYLGCSLYEFYGRAPTRISFGSSTAVFTDRSLRSLQHLYLRRGGHPALSDGPDGRSALRVYRGIDLWGFELTGSGCGRDFTTTSS